MNFSTTFFRILFQNSKKLHQIQHYYILKQQMSTQFKFHSPSDLATNVNWSKLAVPIDDGKAAHLEGMTIPGCIFLPATDGQIVDLAKLSGRTIVFAFPRSGTPIVPWEEWDQIPGARGCTPHSCAFRDLKKDFENLGVKHLFGLSSQDTDFQKELVANAHLNFPILSDQKLELTKALNFPLMEVKGEPMIKRMAMIIDEGGQIKKVFYPVFPPDRNAKDVLEWMQNEQKGNK